MFLVVGGGVDVSCCCCRQSLVCFSVYDIIVDANRLVIVIPTAPESLVVLLKLSLVIAYCCQLVPLLFLPTAAVVVAVVVVVVVVVVTVALAVETVDSC